MDVTLQYSPFVPVEYQYSPDRIISLHALGIGGQSFTRGVKYPFKGVIRVFTGVYVDSYDRSVLPFIAQANSVDSLTYRYTVLNHGLVSVREPIFLDVFSPDVSLLEYGSHLASVIFLRAAV